MHLRHLTCACALPCAHALTHAHILIKPYDIYLLIGTIQGMTDYFIDWQLYFAVGLNAAFMQTYIGGVSCPLVCSKHFVNHGVLLVGYQERGFAPLRLGNKPYWIIKNSWGPHWGEHGFYKLCRGLGECGMNTMVSAVVAQVSPSTNVEFSRE